LTKDKEWLQNNKDGFRIVCVRLEEDLENAKSKKPKGANKKQKEKVVQISTKLNHAKKLKDQFEELNNQMDYIEGGTIKNLKGLVHNYFKSPDED
jgi:hypothetical protein